MKTKTELRNVPEISSYTKYYEHDGMLRAYANRAMFLAILFGAIACGSLGFAIYVRIQPPTVIRVDKNGEAPVLGATSEPDPPPNLPMSLSPQRAAAHP